MFSLVVALLLVVKTASFLLLSRISKQYNIRRSYHIPFSRLIAHRKFDLGAHASISIQDPNDFAVFTLDVFLQLSSADRKAVKKGLGGDSCAPWRSGDSGTLELTRRLEVQPGSFGSFAVPSSNDVQIGQRAKGRESFTSEAESVKGGEILVSGELGGIMLETLMMMYE